MFTVYSKKERVVIFRTEYACTLGREWRGREREEREKEQGLYSFFLSFYGQWDPEVYTHEPQVIYLIWIWTLGSPIEILLIVCHSASMEINTIFWKLLEKETNE